MNEILEIAHKGDIVYKDTIHHAKDYTKFHEDSELRWRGGVAKLQKNGIEIVESPLFYDPLMSGYLPSLSLRDDTLLLHVSSALHYRLYKNYTGRYILK